MNPKHGYTMLMAEGRHVLDGETLNGVSTSSNKGVQQNSPIRAGETTSCECPPHSTYGQDFWIPYPQVLKEKILGAYHGLDADTIPEH